MVLHRLRDGLRRTGRAAVRLEMVLAAHHLAGHILLQAQAHVSSLQGTQSHLGYFTESEKGNGGSSRPIETAPLASDTTMSPSTRFARSLGVSSPSLSSRGPARSRISFKLTLLR